MTFSRNNIQVSLDTTNTIGIGIDYQEEIDHGQNLFRAKREGKEIKGRRS